MILLDAGLTHIAVGYLGAYEVVLFFVNQIPPAIWLVAAGKVLGVMYIDKKMKKYSWVKYGLLAIIFSHLFAVANNTYWLLWRLSLL